MRCVLCDALPGDEGPTHTHLCNPRIVLDEKPHCVHGFSHTHGLRAQRGQRRGCTCEHNTGCGVVDVWQVLRELVRGSCVPACESCACGRHVRRWAPRRTTVGHWWLTHANMYPHSCAFCRTRRPFLPAVVTKVTPPRTFTGATARFSASVKAEQRHVTGPGVRGGDGGEGRRGTPLGTRAV